MLLTPNPDYLYKRGDLGISSDNTGLLLHSQSTANAAAKVNRWSVRQSG
jgi:hypothetical protein